MPGRGSYGKGGKWIHDRAHHIMGKNPDMEKGTAYAIATQQAHKVGKSPKKFRTSEGVSEAKRKFSMPKSAYKKTAMLSMADEFTKIAKVSRKKRALTDMIPLVGMVGGGMAGGAAPLLFAGGNRGLPTSGLTLASTMAGMYGGNAIGNKIMKAVRKSKWYRKPAQEKTAAMGEDLRIKGPAGIRRPAFPTEGSKSLALSQFKQSNKVGKYGNVKPPTPVI